MTSVGIEPTTSGLDLPLLCRLSYEVGHDLDGESRRRESKGTYECDDDDVTTLITAAEETNAVRDRIFVATCECFRANACPRVQKQSPMSLNKENISYRNSY